MNIVFDIGGTNTRIAVCSHEAAFEYVEHYKTPQEFREGMPQLIDTIKRHAGGEHVDQITGGAPGVFDRMHTQLLRVSHLPQWEEQPLKEELERAFPSSLIQFENDTALAGLGEAVHGAGRGYNIVAYVTISTGTNGVRIVDRRIDKRAVGFEIGHHILDMDGSLEPKQNAPGTPETMLTGSAILKQTGKPPEELPDDHPIWSAVTQALTSYLYNVAVFWSPEVIVLGGSLVTKRNIFDPESVHTALLKALTIFPEIPDIQIAELGDKGGLYGAYCLQQISK